MNRLLLLLSNTLLVLLEVIVLTFFASVFFKKNLSTVKFLISIILLAVFNIAALALLDKYFWLKAFVLIIVDAIWLKISYIDTIIQSIGIAVGFYSFVSIWDVLVLLAISFLSKREFSSYMENPVEYYLICYGVKCVELLIVAIIGLLAKKRFQFKNTIWHDWLRAMLFPLTTTFCSVMLFQMALFFIGFFSFVCKRKRPHRVFHYGISQRSFCRCCLRCHCSSSLMMVSSICFGV